MNTSKNYENLDFGHQINVIEQNCFPSDFPIHWHKYAEIIAFPKSANYKQTPVITVNQVRYEMEPGDLLFIWPGELHEITNNSDRLLIGIQFPDSLCSTLPEFVPYMNSFHSYHHIRNSSTPNLAHGLITYLQHMLAVQTKAQLFSGIESIIYLYEMFMSLGLYTEGVKTEVYDDTLNGSGKYREKIHIACNYIIDNCEQPLTLNDIADYVGFSSCYFSRVFRKATNYNFVEYLTLQRVKRASSLLADSSLSITEISFRSGFKSISTFNRVFRQYHSCSPSDYRHYYLS